MFDGTSVQRPVHHKYCGGAVSIGSSAERCFDHSLINNINLSCPISSKRRPSVIKSTNRFTLCNSYQSHARCFGVSVPLAARRLSKSAPASRVSRVDASMLDEAKQARSDDYDGISEKNEDGKSYVNPSNDRLSDAYESFVAPIDNGRRGGEQSCVVSRKKTSCVHLYIPMLSILLWSLSTILSDRTGRLDLISSGLTAACEGT